MSHFYETLKGNRGPATRCGTKGSGMHVQAASWDGCVDVQLFVEDGIDTAVVRLKQWVNGAGPHPSILLYHGPVSGKGDT